ncbi:hypothetical protein Y032_0708g1717 [Ancylostoma ceylanicum]|uniref:Uncharacterized protein n=1 Tax=Ancylostoma ceylanicum TaxID=53326 RepID=A0A016WFK4_9BILA|nr:hypothetical protein Y032_0708g1717 [Ancylostoma ceylanicum]
MNLFKKTQSISDPNKTPYLMRTLTPPFPLLSHVLRNSSSPVSKVTFSVRCLLVSINPMMSYLIFLTYITRSSPEASEARVREMKTWRLPTLTKLLKSY